MVKHWLKAIAIVLIISCGILSSSVTFPAHADVWEDDLTIAFLPRSLGNPVFLDAFEAAQKKAHELGVTLEWVAPFDFDSDLQVEMIENLVRRGVDGIVASVNDEEQIHRVFQKADGKDFNNRKYVFRIWENLNNLYNVRPGLGEISLVFWNGNRLSNYGLYSLDFTAFRNQFQANLQERGIALLGPHRNFLN